MKRDLVKKSGRIRFRFCQKFYENVDMRDDEGKWREGRGGRTVGSRFRFTASLAEGAARRRWPRTESGGEAESHGSQAARASSRILFHFPCSVVMKLNSGKGTGTR